ncbi:MAG: hypothetical protein KKH41_08255 [Candidatus Thermoplasmatota archaeon]|nr:hypothetical protein [Euryarchaeota archaeon]MBU4032205.1 hypothetical protein [Candidatus Thermoplasmatota archaeon]MBU4071813.1 hypothetical protein [Candidatus Thermoplasmatota archaeon]MBU4143950.1 hypothetical protein [Candidatus Thermoplasmatota archaeon]MBU4592557.1 hypothetical protein [Candidatus Thermoplasmatota archaeon]
MAMSNPGRFRHDESAVEGLPMTLIISMVILAITVPLIFGSLRAYDRGRVEAELTTEIDNFISMAQLVYTSGPGNSAVVEFNAVGGSMTQIDYIHFGDEIGGELASTIRYRLQGQQEKIYAITSPNVPMLSAEYTAFQLSSGTHIVLVECIMGDDARATICMSLAQ